MRPGIVLGQVSEPMGSTREWWSCSLMCRRYPIGFGCPTNSNSSAMGGDWVPATRRLRRLPTTIALSPMRGRKTPR